MNLIENISREFNLYLYPPLLVFEYEELFVLLDPYSFVDGFESITSQSALNVSVVFDEDFGLNRSSSSLY